MVIRMCWRRMRRAKAATVATGVALVIIFLMDISTVIDLNRKRHLRSPARIEMKLVHHTPPYHNCPHDDIDCLDGIFSRGGKWIALWVPSEPEVDISHLTEIPGWKTVVVGDGFRPLGCMNPNCVFLDPSGQAALSTSLASILPTDDPVKKNLAYLYAIKQQADFIYDADINVRPLHNLSDFFYSNTSGLVYTKEGVFNYYQHYGEHWFQPPGFVQLKYEHNDPAGYVLSDIPQPEVQYGLVKVKDGTGPRFQSVVPTVFVGSHSVAPFDSRNTLFSRRAFWGLFTFPGSGSDILRSYILQTLLKYINGYVGFLHPNAEKQVTHDAIYRPPTSTVRYLYNWQCTEMKNLQTCLPQLVTDLLEKDVINKRGKDMWFTWLSDLHNARYDISQFKVNRQVRLHPRTNKRDSGYCNESVELSPSPGVFYYNNPDGRSYEQVHKICPNITYPREVSYQYSDILLIVTYNYAGLYNNIYYIEGLYRRYFPNILYCGPGFETFQDAVTTLPVNSSIAFVTGIERSWLYFQECTIYAMKMNFNVKGYLQIGEDTLIYQWNFRTLPREEFWFNAYTLRSTRDVTKNDGWTWWTKHCGKHALNKVFTRIEKLAERSKDSREKRFYHQYMRNVGSFEKIFRQTCDFFYVPQRQKDSFIYFTELFFESSLMLEIAIPTMMLGLDDKRDITRVVGHAVWGKKRDNPQEIFKPEDHYIHAFKGGKQMKMPNCRKFMCEVFLPMTINRMGLPLSKP